MRGLARALVGLLQTGVDFTCRRGQLTACRYVDGTASRGSVDLARNNHHHATLGRLDTAAERRHELYATAAGGYKPSAQISAASRLVPGANRPSEPGLPTACHELCRNTGFVLLYNPPSPRLIDSQ